MSEGKRLLVPDSLPTLLQCGRHHHHGAPQRQAQLRTLRETKDHHLPGFPKLEAKQVKAGAGNRHRAYTAEEKLAAPRCRSTKGGDFGGRSILKWLTRAPIFMQVQWQMMPIILGLAWRKCCGWALAGWREAAMRFCGRGHCLALLHGLSRSDRLLGTTALQSFPHGDTVGAPQLQTKAFNQRRGRRSSKCFVSQKDSNLPNCQAPFLSPKTSIGDTRRFLSPGQTSLAPADDVEAQMHAILTRLRIEDM